MDRIGIFYSSHEGQTARIANRIAALLRAESNARVIVHSIEELSSEFTLSVYQGVIIGGSVHKGHHDKELVEFVIRHRSALVRLRNAFFSVSLSAAGGPEQRDDARRIVDDFYEQTGWIPERSEIFAGALKYRRYHFLLRWIMKTVTAKVGGDTDTSRTTNTRIGNG